MIWFSNYDKFNFSLSSLNLTREEILLLYKHDYHSLIKINEEIDDIIMQYKIDEWEENIFQKVDNLINILYKISELDSRLVCESEELPDSLMINYFMEIVSQKEKLIKENYLDKNIKIDKKYIEEIKKFFSILIKLSEFFFYFPEKNSLLSSIDLEIKKLSEYTIFEYILSMRIEKKDILYIKLETFFKNLNISNYDEAKDKYCIGLEILALIIKNYNIDLGEKFASIVIKKINFFNRKLEILYREISETIKFLEISE